jgi:hypothetical protein
MDFKARQLMYAQAQAVYAQWFASPCLTARKREPDTYCFRCGTPVPGGIFIGNTTYKGRHVSWVDATDMPSRNPVDGSTVPPHQCIQVGQMALAL